MHITLIGMSSIGKSHWSKWLSANRGFELIDCDTLIAKKLAAEGVRFDAAGTLGLSHWMGQPYEPQYPRASRTYIQHEKSAMRQIIEKLRAAPADSNIVVDTSGSVIYVGDDIIERLKTLSKIVYFEASRTHVEELFARDRADPKPLIWDTLFVQRAGEKPEDARQRCFPQLFESRAQRYAAMAHVTVPYEQHKNLDANMDVIFGPNK